MAQKLLPSGIIKTLARLSQRIEERFPDANLVVVARDLEGVANLTARRARALGRPNFLLRVFVFMVIAVGLAAQYFAFRFFLPDLATIDPGNPEVLQALEAMVNLLILAGAAIWFLLSLEEKEKRRFVLKHLHELRSFAHVIDMHQLTKDPVTLSGRATRTASSPERGMSRYEIARYLDYCAEMLSITGKLAALYGEQTHDTEITGAVNDVEDLTAGIARKVWQKIVMLDDALDDAPAAEAAAEG